MHELAPSLDLSFGVNLRSITIQELEKLLATRKFRKLPQITLWKFGVIFLIGHLHSRPGLCSGESPVDRSALLIYLFRPGRRLLDEHRECRNSVLTEADSRKHARFLEDAHETDAAREEAPELQPICVR